MGLIEVLGHHPPDPGPVRRVINRMAGTRIGAAAAAPFLRTGDLLVDGLSGGLTSLTSGVGGQPLLWLEVSRTDSSTRPVPLLPVPIGDDLAVIGSNFGRRAQPAWTGDLLRHPSARARLGDREAAVVARPARDDEIESIWSAAGGLYPGYLRYRSRVTNREIRVFVLEPDPAVPSAP
jgi:deazaflavin-dependent oxidoreductase (nitroreductase family)